MSVHLPPLTLEEHFQHSILVVEYRKFDHCSEVEFEAARTPFWGLGVASRRAKGDLEKCIAMNRFVFSMAGVE